MNRSENPMRTTCLIGATGFVGHHLTLELQRRGLISLRMLEHRNKMAEQAGVTLIQGDMEDPQCLDRLLVPDAVVFNLAYAGVDSALSAATALGQACARTPIRRLVHISTAMVVGDPSQRVIDETSISMATSDYGITKLKVEEILLESAKGAFEIAILRPTAIFGPGGRNLESLARRVKFSSRLNRIVRAMAMGRRHMHAIDVESLVQAMVFIATADIKAIHPVFFVADDEHPLNNYMDIESRMAKAMGVLPLPSWLPYLPSSSFKLILRALGRPDSDPNRVYSTRKLQALGFRGHRDLEIALDQYARWYGETSRAES